MPSFPLPIGDPFRDTGIKGNPDFIDFYVTRDGKDIEVIAEVTRCDWTCHEEDHELCIEIGDCFDLHGQERILSLEEMDQARQDWITVQQRRAAKAEKEAR